MIIIHPTYILLLLLFRGVPNFELKKVMIKLIIGEKVTPINIDINIPSLLFFPIKKPIKQENTIIANIDISDKNID